MGAETLRFTIDGIEHGEKLIHQIAPDEADHGLVAVIGFVDVAAALNLLAANIDHRGRANYAPAFDGELTTVAVDNLGHGAAGGFQGGPSVFWDATHGFTGTSATSQAQVVEFNTNVAAITAVTGPLPTAATSAQVAAVVYDQEGRLHIAGTVSADVWTWSGSTFTTVVSSTPFLARKSAGIDWVRTPALTGVGAQTLCLGADTTSAGMLLVGGALLGGTTLTETGTGLSATGTAPLLFRVFD